MYKWGLENNVDEKYYGPLQKIGMKIRVDGNWKPWQVSTLLQDPIAMEHHKPYF